MLEDVLLRANVSQSAVPRLHRAGHSPYPSRGVLTVMESVVSRSSYSLPTTTEAGKHSMVHVGSMDDADDHEHSGVCRTHESTDEGWSLEERCRKIC